MGRSVQFFAWVALDCGCNICELTVLFCHPNRCFDGGPELAAYFDYRKRLRLAYTLLSKLPEGQIFPGSSRQLLLKLRLEQCHKGPSRVALFI